MFKKIVCIVIVLTLLGSVMLCAFAAKPDFDMEPSATQNQIPDEDENFSWTETQKKAHEIAVLARELGLDEANPIIVEASRIWWADCGEDFLTVEAAVENHYGLDVYWTEADAEMLAKLIYAEARGISFKMEKAAVVWCVLNRVDESASTITSIVTAPNQFAYSPYSPTVYLGEDFVALAEDVLARWSLEREGRVSVGRVLPAEYRWFGGDGVHNHFRDQYIGGNHWDWSLPDPYEEDAA